MELVVATDGACHQNPNGIAAWAWYIDKSNWKVGSFEQASNNVAELAGIIEASKALIEYDGNIRILSDSQYAIKSLRVWSKKWEQYGWKKLYPNKEGNYEIANLDLIKEGYYLLKNKDNIKLDWVKGHSGHFLNDAADSLATGTVQRILANKNFNSGPGYSGL